MGQRSLMDWLQWEKHQYPPISCAAGVVRMLHDGKKGFNSDVCYMSSHQLPCVCAIIKSLLGNWFLVDN